jgi:hypothetical protein
MGDEERAARLAAYDAFLRNLETQPLVDFSVPAATVA